MPDFIVRRTVYENLIVTAKDVASAIKLARTDEESDWAVDAEDYEAEKYDEAI